MDDFEPRPASASSTATRKPSFRLKSLGPGLILAAAGIGAGDAVVASVTGIRHGATLLWAIALTAVLKFALTESIARWQLATGETVAHAWMTRLPRWVGAYLCAYLVLWTFLVGASLSSACGLAAASLVPQLSVKTWGAIHALAAAAMVAANRFSRFQTMMKVLVAIMALSMLICAILAKPDLTAVATGLVVPRVPAVDGAAAVLALLGGIGGSLTVICYGYWLRETGWSGSAMISTVRRDVGLAYLFTGLFGIALVLIAAGVKAPEAAGTRIALEIAARLETVGGPAFRWIFLLGFWCTVFSAMLGVWQGVPHVYVDVARVLGKNTIPDRRVYLAALAWISVPPLALLWFRQPVAVVVLFSIVGAFFMPFLAATLLYMNNRRDWMGALVNRRIANAALVICLLVFGWVCAREVVRAWPT